MKRIEPTKFVGAYQFWGIENREAPIRLVYPYNVNEEITNFEIKTLDHTANTYYALAAIIYLGY